MAFSMELELEDGGKVTYDNVVRYTVEEVIEDEEMEEDVEEDTEILIEDAEPSPDEVPEDGDEEREGNNEVDLSQEPDNPMEEVAE